MKLKSVALLFAIAALVAGCGDDKESTESGGSDSPPLTKAEFLEQGNAVCAEGNEAIDAAAADLNQNSPQQEIEAFASETLVPEVQKQIDGLSELSPPEGDEAQVEAIIEAAQEANDQVEEDPSLITSNEDPFNEANDLASEYGLTECAG